METSSSVAPPRRRWPWAWLAVAVVGMGLRVAYLAQFQGSPLYDHPVGPDVQEYAAWAREIRVGAVLWPEPRIHSPLYPLALAGLYALGGMSHHFVRMAQSLLVLAAILPLLAAMCLAAGRADRELGARGTLLWAALLWSVYPPLIYHSAELVSEVLLLPLLALSIWGLYRAEEEVGGGWLAMAGAGCAAGLAVIAHPLALFVVLAEGGWLGWSAWRGAFSGQRSARLRGAVFLVAGGLAMAPVVGYNLLVLKGAPLQANGGFNFWLGNSAEADGTCRLRPGPEWDQVHRHGETGAAARNMSKDGYFLSATFADMAARPWRTLARFAAKAAYAVNFRELAAGADVAPLREFTPLMRWTRGAFAITGIAALTLLLLRWRQRAFLFSCRHFLIVGGAFWLGQILFVASGRYRLGMLLALIPLAALAIQMMLERWRMRLWPSPRGLVATGIAAAVVLLPRPPSRPEAEQVEADSILAEAWLLAGRPDFAVRYAQRSAAGQPQWSRHHNLLGLAWRGLGRDDEAMVAFTDAAAVEPDAPEALMNIAVIHADYGRIREAEATFAQAYLVAPPSPDLEYNYALFLQRGGRLAEAATVYRAAVAMAPAHRRARTNLGVVLMMQGFPEQAAAEFARAIRIAPDDPRLRVNYAAALADAGRPAAARRILDQVLRRHPDLPAARELRKQLDGGLP